MEAIIIRDYMPRDWESLVDIHDSARKMELALAGLEAAFVPLEEAAENEGLFEYSLRVAVIHGEVVGFSAFTDEELAWLYVHPKHMRSGIGKALIQDALDHADNRPLTIEVLQGNAPALSLYESMGFLTTEMVTGAMPGNEAFQVTVHHMEKQ